MINHHPLTAHALGDHTGHVVFNAAPKGHPADWRVKFMYQHGHVECRIVNREYVYATTMNPVIVAKVRKAPVRAAKRELVAA